MPDNSAANKRIAKNTLFLSIRMVVVMCISLYTSRVFLNVLGVVDYGISNVVYGFVSMFTFLNTALTNGTQRFYNYELGANSDSAITKVYTTSFLIQLIVAVLIVILLETIGLWYLYNKMVLPAERFDATFWLYQMSVFSTFLIIMLVPYNAAITAYERMDYFAFLSIFDVVTKLGFAFAIPYIDFDKLILFGLFSTGLSIANFLLNFVYAKHNFRYLKFERVFHKDLFKRMFAFSGWNFFGTFSGIMRTQGLNMILNLFFGPVVNAARGIANQVSGAIQGFVGTVGVAIKPQIISSYAAGDISRSMNLMYAMSKARFIIMYIFALPLSFEIDYVLHLWLGDAVPEHSAAFVLLTFMICFINNFNAPVSDVVHATGVMKKYQVVTATIGLLVIPISYVALKMNEKPEIIFAIDFCTMFIVQVVSLFILRSLVTFSIQDYLRKVILPLALVVLSTVWLPYVLNQCMAENFGRLVVVTAISMIAVLVAFYFLGLASNEKALVNNALIALKRKLLKK